MLNSKVIKKVIDDLKNITKISLCICDNFSNILASNFNDEKILKKYIIDFSNSEAEMQVINEFIFFKVFENSNNFYIVISKGNSENAYQIGKICASQLENLIVAYKNKDSKIDFIQNLLLDNMLLSDIYNKAKNLNIENSTKRVVILIQTEYEKDNGSLELIKNIFNEKGDFITVVDEKYIVLLKALKDDLGYEDVLNICNIILDMFNTELMIKAKVSYGSIIKDLKNVSKSYKEAKMSLDVANIFYSEKNIIGYNSLGIGRIIYQLPLNLCKIYIKEVFKEKNIEDIDKEILYVAYKFFENSLNISETARNLYIHRNTLVYRLEKLQKLTNLDIKNFDDALTFKMGIMISNYIKYIESRER